MSWPKLSDRQLESGACCICGARAALGVELHAWEEHDEADRPTDIAVEVCEACVARKLIDKHPRLYRKLDPMEPFPGCMRICEGCRFKEGPSCTHPAAKRNGGDGVTITVAHAIQAIACGSDRGGRWSRRFNIWADHPKACAERVAEPECRCARNEEGERYWRDPDCPAPHRDA